MDLQRTDPGRQVDDAGNLLLLQPLVDDVNLEPQFEIQVVRTEFDEEITITRAAHDHLVIALAERVDETGTTFDFKGF